MVVCSVSVYRIRQIQGVPKQLEYGTLVLRNVKVLKRNEYFSYTHVSFRFYKVFGNWQSSRQSERSLFLSERSLSKRGLNLLQRCNKKTQRCIHRIRENTEILRALMLRNGEVSQRFVS